MSVQKVASLPFCCFTSIMFGRDVFLFTGDTFFRFLVIKSMYLAFYCLNQHFKQNIHSRIKSFRLFYYQYCLCQKKSVFFIKNVFKSKFAQIFFIFHCKINLSIQVLYNRKYTHHILNFEWIYIRKNQMFWDQGEICLIWCR